MSFVKISSKGQITIPSKIRTFLGIEAKEKIELFIRKKNNEVVMRPVKSFRKFRGSLVHKNEDAEKAFESSVAKHVLENDK